MPIRMRTIPTRTTRTRITRRGSCARRSLHADYARRSHACGQPRIIATSRPMQRRSRSRRPAATRRLRGGQPPHAEEATTIRRAASAARAFVTAVILIGCAMLGTAGAYGYRTYATRRPARSRRRSSSPTVRRARSFPRPSQKSARSQDRVGAARAATSGWFRAKSSRLPCRRGTVGSARACSRRRCSRAPATTGSTPSAVARRKRRSRPKRVRTVTIRPEGGDSSGQPSGNEAPARAAPPRRADRAAAARRAPARDQPLSLDPNAAAPANEPARAQPQQRALTPPAPRETAAPRGCARTPGRGRAAVRRQWRLSGAGVVAAQRSRTRRRHIAALQAKYSQLKSHQPIIRRADLGSKGVYLSRHGRSVRIGRGGCSVLQRAQASRRTVHHPSELMVQ